MRAAAALPIVVLASLTVAGCESSQSRSARLESQSDGQAANTTVKLGKPSPHVDVLEAKVVRTAVGTAAVVRLRNTGKRDEMALPIQIDVQDRTGASVYKNDIEGLQPALQQLALLRAGRTAYWVNDQVVAATPARKVNVTVGRGAPATTPAPDLRITGAHLRSDSSGPFAEGRILSTAATDLRQVPVFAVARRGGRIVAAGRALVEKVPAKGGKPVRFKIYFIGDPRGARLTLNAVPTTGKGPA